MPNELTNPNNVVTEERLAQFYQQILPYLGGMPDVLANKFNRADLYSTDEKLIGRWIDGKPLYQKTVTINALPNVTTTEYDVGLTNVSYCNISGYVLFPSGNKATIPYVDVTNVNSCISVQGNANGKVAVAVRADRRGCSAVLTLQYTKTTDSAVEIGSDTDYSTTEKIVGTWIDGKPLYQRTLAHDGMYLHASSWTTLFADQAWAANVDRIISSKISALTNEGYPRTVNPLEIRINGTAIQYTADAYASGGPIYVTLQYTKTS